MKQVEVSILGQVYMLGCPEGGETLLAAAVASVDREMTTRPSPTCCAAARAACRGAPRWSAARCAGATPSSMPSCGAWTPRSTTTASCCDIHPTRALRVRV